MYRESVFSSAQSYQFRGVSRNLAGVGAEVLELAEKPWCKVILWLCGTAYA